MLEHAIWRREPKHVVEVSFQFGCYAYFQCLYEISLVTCRYAHFSIHISYTVMDGLFKVLLISDWEDLQLVVPAIENALFILTLKQAENDDIGYVMLPCLILIRFLF